MISMKVSIYWRPTSHFENFNWHDLMALFPVWKKPRWWPPPSWKNFKWPYLRNRSSDPLHVWF